MPDLTARRSEIAIVVSSMAVGGPQKSLLGLLERIDPDLHHVHLFVLDPAKDSLAPFVPDHITLLPTPPVVTAATLPRGRAAWALRKLFQHLCRAHRWIPLLRLVSAVTWGALSRAPGQQVRQRVWSTVGPILPSVPGRFDAALGVLGLSTYAAVDLVQARHKYHWVRSDSRILDRDHDLEKRYFGHLSGALAVSPTVDEIFTEIFPELRGRTRVYKNDIPTRLQLASDSLEWPAANLGTLKLLTVTRLDPLKGLDLAVEACAQLEELGLAVSWVVLGSGTEEANLRRLVTSRGQDERFHLIGTVLDTSAYLALADIYVHPSRTEGRSNAVEEARARGKAIIATSYPTVVDQVTDGVNGLVCEINAHSLTAAIARLGNDSLLRARIGAAAAKAYESERDDPNWLLVHLARGNVPQRSS